MIGSKNFFKNGSRDPDHAQEVVCHPRASTWYILPAYKVWQLRFSHSEDMIAGIETEKWVM